MICWATSIPTRRRELRVAVEALLVAQQLLDARDLADALHLDHDRAAVAVAAQQVDRADVGRVLAADEREVVAQRGDARREQLLQLGFDAVLLEPGIVAERRPSCRAAPRAASMRSVSPFGVARDDHAVVLLDHARRVHPVERLVRLGVGVDRDRAVGLEQDEPGRRREPRAEPTFVFDRAAGDEQTHVLNRQRSERLASLSRRCLGYDEVLKELVLALGAALFLGNLLALFRRGSDAEKAKTRTVARTRPGEPGPRQPASPANRDLAQAPVARSVSYMAIGLVVMIWALASIIN